MAQKRSCDGRRPIHAGQRTRAAVHRRGTPRLPRLHSAELKKELRLGDLVLTQILFITGLSWLGTAGKLGSSHIMFWIPAAFVLLFYVTVGNREWHLI